jgi:hypothetical protein
MNIKELVMKEVDDIKIIQAKLKLIPNGVSVCLEDLNEVRLEDE